MEQIPIIITKGTTRTAVTIDSNNPAAVYLRGITQRVLTDHEYDPRHKRMIPTKKYMKYDTLTNQLYLPVELTTQVVDLFLDMGFDYKVVGEAPYKLRDIAVRMKSSFVPRPHQIPVINHLTQEEPHRKGLAIQTGSGKTVSSIAGAIAYGKPFMIVVSRLHQQWVRAIEQFTDAQPEQICMIQGFNSLADIIESERKPDIFVFSLETLRAYCLRQGKYEPLPPFSKFVEYFGIGTKIMDEVHLNFHADTIIDLSCNIPNNIYLTATFTSGNPSTRKIFNLIYPPRMRFGDSVLERYTDAYCYGYSGEIPEKRCVSQRGYMHIKYEKYLLKRPQKLLGFFNTIIRPIIQAHYINRKQDGEKLAIFFAMIEMVDYAYSWFKENYPELKITKYIGGTADNVLNDNEVIITTAKSCGVGTDIKNLVTVINTVSTKSPPAVLQICGRLRKIPGRTTEYIDLCDLNMISQKHHQRARESILKTVVRSYKKYRMP